MIEMIKIICDACKSLHRGPMRNEHRLRQLLVYQHQGVSLASCLGWVFLLTMLTSCINEIPYNAEIGAPKLVLNAMLQPDSLLTATVSSTAHFLDIEEPQRLADATVVAVVNDKEVTLTYSADTTD